MKHGVVIVFYFFTLLVTGSLMACNPASLSSGATIPSSIYDTPANSQSELYKDMCVTLLEPYIRQEIKRYYGESHCFALYDVKFLDIVRPYGYRTFVFRVKIEVEPYTGAHNPIGTDHITFLIPSEPSGQVKVEKFEHIRTYRY